MTSKYLKEFEELNTTTDSIYDLGEDKVLIIATDGKKFTNWKDIHNRGFLISQTPKSLVIPHYDGRYDREDIMYLSEDLSNSNDIADKYINLTFTKAIILTNLTDKINSLDDMFYGCSSLVDLAGLDSWDMSNVESMYRMFYNCSSLENVSFLKDLDVSNVKTMAHMFHDCSSLTDISGLNDWNVSNVEYMTLMFVGCSSLEDVSPLKDWDVSNVKSLNHMFGGCSSLVDLSPLDNWDVSNVENIGEMFYNCPNIEVYPSWYEK